MLSDVQVVISIQDGGEEARPAKRSCCSLTPGKAAVRKEHARFPGHKIVLCNSSGYVRAEFERWRVNDAANVGQDKPELCFTAVDRREAEALERLVRFLYEAQLPADYPLADVLPILAAADQYEALLCIQACIQHISSSDISTWDAQFGLQLCMLPQLQTDARSYRGVLGRLADWAVQHFASLEEAWGSSSDNLEAFNALPPDTLLHVLQSDLHVWSENVPILAVEHWLQAQPKCSRAQLAQQLLAHLRLPQATSAFLAHVLPSLQLLQLAGAAGASQLALAHQWRSSGEAWRPALSSHLDSTHPAWLQPRSRPARPTPHPLVRWLHTWDVPYPALQKVVAVAEARDCDQELRGPEWLVNGFAFQLVLVAYPPSKAAQWGRVFCGLELCPARAEHRQLAAVCVCFRLLCSNTGKVNLDLSTGRLLLGRDQRVGDKLVSVWPEDLSCSEGLFTPPQSVPITLHMAECC